MTIDRKIQKAQDAQTIVAEYLRERGFEVAEVQHPYRNGVDLVAIKGHKHFSVEVKTPVYSSRAWKVNKAHDKSDYVAVVMPNRSIHIESMEDWKRLCRSNGVRTLTKIVQFYE